MGWVRDKRYSSNTRHFDEATANCGSGKKLRMKIRQRAKIDSERKSGRKITS